MAEHGTGALEPINSWAASAPTYGNPGAPPIALYGVLGLIYICISILARIYIAPVKWPAYTMYQYIGPNTFASSLSYGRHFIVYWDQYIFAYVKVSQHSSPDP